MRAKIFRLTTFSQSSSSSAPIPSPLGTCGVYQVLRNLALTEGDPLKKIWSTLREHYGTVRGKPPPLWPQWVFTPSVEISLILSTSFSLKSIWHSRYIQKLFIPCFFWPHFLVTSSLLGQGTGHPLVRGKVWLSCTGFYAQLPHSKEETWQRIQSMARMQEENAWTFFRRIEF